MLQLCYAPNKWTGAILAELPMLLFMAIWVHILVWEGWCCGESQYNDLELGNLKWVWALLWSSTNGLGFWSCIVRNLPHSSEVRFGSAVFLESQNILGEKERREHEFLLFWPGVTMQPCLSLSEVICDSSQFAQWVGRVPVSEALNNKVKNKLHVHEWMAASLTFVYLSSFPSPHLEILTAKFWNSNSGLGR